MNDVGTKKFIFGLLIVIVIVKILKRIIRQDRPQMNGKTDYGMPSTRAGIVFFIAIYLLLENDKLSQSTRIFLIMFACMSSYMKYYLNEHTISQLLLGGIIGVLVAYILHK